MSTILPDAPWRRREGLDRLAAILGGSVGEARFVGGVVRDTLLGIDAADRGTVAAHAVSAGAACCTKRLSGCPDVTTIFTGNCC